MNVLNMEDIYVKAVYDKIADDFSITRVSIWRGVKKFLDEITSLSVVADLGCGNGKNIQRKDLFWYGLDQCEKFIKICENKFKDWNNPPILKKGSIIDIPFSNESVDCVICIATFHHLSSNENRHKCLNEIHRIMKYGGKGLITVWAYEYDNDFQWDKEVKKQGGQDILIPWKGINKQLMEKRYYHFFKKDEITQLIMEYFSIDEIWFETNNWFIKFSKK